VEQKSLLIKALAEEEARISDALKSIGYQAIKIDITQIASAEQGSIDINIWARTEEAS